VHDVFVVGVVVVVVAVVVRFMSFVQQDAQQDLVAVVKALDACFV